MEMQSWFCFMQGGKENYFEFDVNLVFTFYMCYPGTRFTHVGYYVFRCSNGGFLKSI